jgi:hypothetical protein
MMTDLEEILTYKEGVWLDFKREFHANTAKLLHDILCLSNALYDGNRFIVFGVDDNAMICGVESDPNKKTNAEIHDFLRQLHFNRIPKVGLTFHKLEGHQIGLLQITNSPDKPYTIQQDFKRDKTLVRAGVVYTRLGDTNIPPNETAPDDHIERMWKERLEDKHAKSLSLEDNFPVKLNDPFDQVIEVLGQPDATGWQVAQYYSEGIEIYFDQHFDFVEALTIYHLPSGTACEGTLFGIKLGDSFIKVKSLLGPPAYWGLVYEKSSMAVWEFVDTLLVIQVWSDKNRTGAVPFQQLGTVRLISHCNRKSQVAYSAMVVKVIQQIRQGTVPKEFESEDISVSGIKLDDPIFHETYELLGVRQAIMGGAEVLIGFHESKTVIAFWIYPLMWRNPVVRAIYSTGGPPTEDTLIDPNSRDLLSNRS